LSCLSFRPLFPPFILAPTHTAGNRPPLEFLLLPNDLSFLLHPVSPSSTHTHTAAPPEGRVDDARMCCQLLGLFFFIIFSLQKFFSFFSTYSFSLSPSLYS
jgi:hypothetical protein